MVLDIKFDRNMMSAYDYTIKLEFILLFLFSITILQIISLTTESCPAFDIEAFSELKLYSKSQKTKELYNKQTIDTTNPRQTNPGHDKP